LRKKSRRLKLSIIVPVYNEERTLEALLRKVLSAPALGLPKEVLVVDDGSTDRTGPLLRGIRDGRLRKFRHERNRGKGAAIRTALGLVRGDLVLIQDADLEYDPADYGKLLPPLVRGEAEVVYGSRFRKGSPPGSLWQWAGNKALNLAANLLFNTHLGDMETGYKVFRTDVLKGLDLRASGFDFDPEVTAKVLRQGRRILEVPIAYRPRNYAQGKKITWWDGVTALLCLLKCRFQAFFADARAV
jgi:glycosyltransferase involved in cell wall biosynthesis